MYGKSFSKMFLGSMVGAGSHVFAVWGYCIACADPESHTVDLNPTLLATIIGESQERIQAAIDFLCSPDPHSHCMDNEGARLVKQTGHEYFLTTHEVYRNIKRNDDLREYNREAKRRERDKKRLSMTVNDSQGQTLTPASAYATASSPDRGCKGKEFDAFWLAYPRKIGKKAAQKSWERAKDQPALAVILSAVETQKQSGQWCKDGGQYIPHPATWLNQGRWDDKPLVATGAMVKRPCNIRMQYRDRTTGTWLPEGWAIPKDCPNPDNFVIQEHKL